jgi:hypothetical protein
MEETPQQRYTLFRKPIPYQQKPKAEMVLAYADKDPENDLPTQDEMSESGTITPDPLLQKACMSAATSRKTKLDQD